MSRIAKGRRIALTYQEKGATGRPTLIVDVSADDDVLPHEHREDMREIAAEVLGVPLKSLEGVEVELKKTGGDHTHPGDPGHEHEHPHPHEEKEKPAARPMPPKAKA